MPPIPRRKKRISFLGGNRQGLRYFLISALTFSLATWILGTHDENPQNQSFETIDFTAFFAFLLEKYLVMCYN